MMYHRTPASGRAGRGGGCGPVGRGHRARRPKDPSPAWLRKAGFSFREPGDRSRRAAYGPAACATTMPAWIMPRSGMTRPALTSPPTPAADAQCDAAYAAPHRGRDSPPGQELPQTPAGLLLVILPEDQRRPSAPRHRRLYDRPRPRSWRAGPRRVIIIRCERRLFVNTPAKNWAMTVRQIGWLKIHPSLGQKTETMTPSVASDRRLSRPRATLALRQPRKGARSWACRGGDPMDRPLGLAWCPPLAVAGTRLQGKADRRRRTAGSINSINKAPAGRWGRGSRACAPVARGVRYNWKGPPIGLPSVR
jgi:hypothetical protein